LLLELLFPKLLLMLLLKLLLLRLLLEDKVMDQLKLGQGLLR